MTTALATALKCAGLDPDQLPPYLRVSQAATLAGVSRDTVRGWLERGLVEYYRFEGTIRIDTRSVVEFITRARRGEVVSAKDGPASTTRPAPNK